MHENHYYPHIILSDHGNSRANNEYDSVACLEDFTTPGPVSDPPTVDAIISDCPAVVHLLDPRTARTSSDYADRVFQSYHTLIKQEQEHEYLFDPKCVRCVHCRYNQYNQDHMVANEISCKQNFRRYIKQQ